MLSENERLSAIWLLDRVFALLDEQQMMERVDLPLDRALSRFHPYIPQPITYPDFIRLSGELVACLYEHGLALPRLLPPDRARAEAIWLLTVAYQGTYSNDCGAAWDDARQGPDGMNWVLGCLGEIVRSIERTKYIRYVLETNVKLRPWHERSALAQVLLETQPQIQHTPLGHADPAFRVANLDQGIMSVLKSNSEWKQYISRLAFKF